MRKITITFLLVAVCALALGFYVQASGGAESPLADEEGQIPTDSSPETIFDCDGGRQQAVLVRINDDVTQIGETGGNFVPLQDASRTLVIDRHRTLVVTFSAEARLFDGGRNDWLELEVRDNDVPMEPQSVPAPLGFKGEDSWSSHSATFCKRVEPGSHTISVHWRLTDTGANHTLRGWLDDWTLHIEVAT